VSQSCPTQFFVFGPNLFGLFGCPCPGSVPWSAAGWTAAGGMAYSVVSLALAKSRWLFAAL